MKWDNHSARPLRVHLMAAFRSQEDEAEAEANSAFSAYEAVHRGSLGMHLNGAGEDLAFEFWTPSVKAVLVFLDQHAGFASHTLSLLRWRCTTFQKPRQQEFE
jgi:hypothetical protein